MGSRMIQNYTKVKKEILAYLFERYKADGGAKTYDVSNLIKAHSFSLTEVGNYLVQNRLVKNEMFKPNAFYASISTKGIKETDPEFLNSEFSKIIATLLLNGNKKSNLLQILEYEPKNLQIADDIAMAFKEIGFANIELSEEGISVSLNSKGWEYYSGKNLSNLLN